MSTGIAIPVPPGWYQDPSNPNPSARRWWDGNTWTAHVHSVAVPVAAASSYQGAFAQPEAPAVGRRNAFGWFALALTVLDFALGVISVDLPALVPAMVPVSVGAVVLAIIALVLRGRRKATILAVPIIALVFSVLISVIASLAWAGQTAWHNQLEADSQSVVYPNSPELTTLVTTTRTIERGIRARGSAFHWPASVSADPDGKVYVGGTLVATLGPGESMSYEVTKSGEDFVLTVRGRVPGEYFYYDLDTHEIDTFCDTGDDACDSN